METILHKAPTAQEFFLTNPQQLDLLLEPQRLYHADQITIPARFALCTKQDAQPIRQEFFDVARLDWALRQVENVKDRNVWIGQATLKPHATNRRISSIILLNAVWCDIDIKHPGKDYKGIMPMGDVSNDKEATRMAGLLAQDLEAEGLPAPTCIVATGGGLCVKWVFETAIAAAARPRWQSLQKHINQRIAGIVGKAGDLSWSWPVDAKATDAPRVLRLVGTHNPKWNAPCRIVWDFGQQWDFDYLADEVLPYTRDEVLQFRESAKLRAENKPQNWAENRERADALGIKSKKSLLIEDEAARGLWSYRLELAKAVFDARGGVKEGHRNNYFWPLANALAWSCTGADQLIHELAALHQAYFSHKGWTRGEAMQAAATVLRRVKEPQGWNTGLYKIPNQLFFDKLDITKEEVREFGSSPEGGRKQNRAGWKVGVMGFEPMRGLEFDAYLAETRRRQTEAGRVAGRVAGSKNLPVVPTNKASDDKRAKAQLMRNSGVTFRAIADELGVSVGAVHKWCA